MDTNIYNKEFHNNREAITRHSAEEISSILLKKFDIKTVCDIGGGIGVWLNVFKNKIPKKHFKGVLFDGNYISKDMLLDPDLFQECDLEKELETDQKFDLAICLEVAEHISAKRADSLIRDLTKLSDIILFSAAVPMQGGQGHINEQPCSYWRNIFKKYKFTCYDLIRPEIKNDDNIPFWYKNNIFIYTKKKLSLKEFSQSNDFADFIHYDMYKERLIQIKELEIRLKKKEEELLANRWTLKNFFQKVKNKFFMK